MGCHDLDIWLSAHLGDVFDKLALIPDDEERYVFSALITNSAHSKADSTLHSEIISSSNIQTYYKHTRDNMQCGESLATI